jgi:surfactin synthase thioesterase subunit
LTLICFPFGGGAAGVFWSWRSALADDIELWALRLPGRESRIAEPFATDAGEVVAAIVGELKPLRDRALVFYGHSMGAGLAYQTAMALRTNGEPLPKLLIASGRLPPHKPYLGGWGEQPDDILVDHVRRLGGLPEDSLPSPQQQDLLALSLPKIRADFRLNDTVFYGRAQRFDFPITIINGVDDPLVDSAGLEEWREHTTGAFRSFTISGAHFCLQTHPDQLLAIVAAQLDAVTPAP